MKIALIRVDAQNHFLTSLLPDKGWKGGTVMKSLVPWSQRSSDLIEGLRHEMDDLVTRFFGGPREGNGWNLTEPWSPRVDVEETDKEIRIHADLPGIDPKDVDITLTEGALILKGEKKDEREEKKKNYHRLERFSGQFYRQIPLPAGIDAEKITATSAKGVVTVTVPKKPESQSKKISIKASS